jgi:glucose/arabinose dehydrogenase
VKFRPSDCLAALLYSALMVTTQALHFTTPVVAQDFTTEKHAVSVDTVASGLNHPWGLAFLPGGAMLVTERPGTLRLITKSRVSDTVSGVPRVWPRGQGGLLDIALDRDFANNRVLFLS